MPNYRNYRSNNHPASAVVFWMVLLISGAAADIYFERPDDDSKYQIGNGNKVDAVVTFDDLNPDGDDLRRNRMMAIMMQYADKPENYKGSSLKVEDPSWSEFELKDPSVKKWVTLLSNNISFKPAQKNRQQLKWKMAKGTTVICYFKLCSFKQLV